MTWLSDYSTADIVEAQKLDPDISPVIPWVESGKTPTRADTSSCSANTKTLANRFDQLKLEEGLLVRYPPPSRSGRVPRQIVLPRTLRDVVLHQLHDLRVVGHLGIQRTIARVQDRFYWPSLSLDVARWCQACPKCAGRQGKPGPGRVPLTQLPVGAPFERIAVDVLDTRQRTPSGHQYILVVSDYFTKYTDAFPMRRHTAETVADLLMRLWVTQHGVPKFLHSDQGREYESKTCLLYTSPSPRDA